MIDDPNFVREPYGHMFSNLQFQLPKTAEMARARKPGIPEWAYLGEGSMLTDSSGSSRDIDSNLNFAMQQTFGMVKLIDDSLGKMLDFLESRGIQDDTVSSNIFYLQFLHPFLYFSYTFLLFTLGHRLHK